MKVSMLILSYSLIALVCYLLYKTYRELSTMDKLYRVEVLPIIKADCKIFIGICYLLLLFLVVLCVSIHVYL